MTKTILIEHSTDNEKGKKEIENKLVFFCYFTILIFTIFKHLFYTIKQ